MGKIALQSISASARWLKCTASLQWNKDFIENVNTLKGNLIHKVIALRLKEIFFKENHREYIKKLKTDDYVSEKNKDLKTKWDNDCEKTFDGCIAYARKMYNQYKPHTIEIEKKVNLIWYGYKKFGYIDFIMISDEYTIIIDWKTGRTVVENDDNSQMLMYAVGKIQEQRKQKDFTPMRYIISICQPLLKLKPPFQYTINQISRFYNSHKKAMDEIISGNLVFRPSSLACKWCDHRDSCNERIKQGVV